VLFVTVNSHIRFRISFGGQLSCKFTLPLIVRTGATETLFVLPPHKKEKYLVLGHHPIAYTTPRFRVCTIYLFRYHRGVEGFPSGLWIVRDWFCFATLHIAVSQKRKRKTDDPCTLHSNFFAMNTTGWWTFRPLFPSVDVESDVAVTFKICRSYLN